MKAYRNLIDLYYKNAKDISVDMPFICDATTQLTFKETEALTNAIAHCFLKKIHSKKGVVIIFSTDVFIKAVCAIALVKINFPFVYLGLNEKAKIDKIKTNFNIVGIVCDILPDQKIIEMLKCSMVYQVQRKDFLNYIEFGNVTKVRKYLSCQERENLPFRIQFTSGTTGIPKMNVLQQFDIADCINDYRIHFIEQGKMSKVAQYLSLDYSFGIDAFFSTIFNGLPVYLFEENEKKDILCMFNKIQKENIDAVCFPSSLINIVAKTSFMISKLPTSLKTIFVGGESIHLTQEFWDAIKQLGIDLVVSYGCSEMQQVLFNTIKLNKANDVLKYKTFINKSNDSCDFFALKENGEIASNVGEKGILFIRRKNKFKDDYDSFRLNTQKFVSLFNDNLIYYNTSDIVVVTEAGYELCGRNERRFKVRDLWVDLDIINQMILELGSVVFSYTTVYVDDFNNTRLACLYLGDAQKRDVIQYLQTKVQSHEIPSLLVKLDSFPLTTAGKTDTQKCEDILKDLLKNRKVDNEIVLGGNIDRTIKAIFEKYSEHACEYPDATFSDLGIDSLLFVVILCEIEENLQIRLNMESINLQEINSINKLVEKISSKL